MHTDAILSEFTRQSAAFNAAPVMRSAETLQSVVDSVPTEAAGGTWAEIACGPGLVSRALAPKLRRIVGIDLTRGMLDVGRHATTEAGITNVAFVRGDALHLPVADGALDGAVTRFSLHHIPVPIRCVAEMGRVVRPGGLVVIADHVTTTDGAGAAWHQEVERLRDPSHWACLTADALRATGEQAGLSLLSARLIPINQEYEEWLTRGTGGEQSRSLLEQTLRERPEQAESFRVTARAGGERILHLTLWLSVWQRPATG